MKRYLPVLMLALVMIVPQAGFSQDDVATMLYNEGLRKYILKDYTGAITDLAGAYQLEADNIKIKNMYLNTLVKQGNIEYERGNLTEARRLYERALELSGEDEELKNKLSIVKERIVSQSVKPTSRTPESERLHGSEPPTGEVDTPQVEYEAEAGGAGPTTLAAPAAAPAQPEALRESAPPTVIQVELPFDIEEFIRSQNEENKRILDQIIHTQQEERENLFRNMQLIAEAQREDRQFFNRSLILVLVAAGAIVLLPLLVIVSLILARRKALLRTGEPGATSSVLTHKPTLLLEATEGVDETQYVDQEQYSEIVRAKRLRELYQQFVSGNLSWDVVSEYISELNRELKEEILRVVERKIESPEATDLEATLPVLFPLMTDDQSDISAYSRQLTGKVTESMQAPHPGSIGEQADIDEGSDPLSLNSLLQIGRLIDNKSGIHGHSIRVAEISGQIAQQIDGLPIEPVIARKVGLVHNIGYLDIDDQLFRYQGPLSEEQFAMVRSHPERGVRLLEYANPPEIFVLGIRYHHERLDGSGYPEGLKADQIPLIARIIAVADSFAAATSPRPYRKALPIGLCLSMMEKIAGTLIDEKLYRILFDLYADRREEGT